MKVFISYKFAEEDLKHLNEFMSNLKFALQKSKHEILTTFFHADEFKKTNASMKKIMDTALNYINNSDIILCIIKSPEKSEGMILEIGYAIARKKRIILAIKEGIESRWITHYAEKTIKFKDLPDLYSKIEDLK